MAIYGTAILSISLLVGLLVGRLLGLVVGVEANVGGVGIAMLVLILLTDRLRQQGRLPTPTQSGILFWSSIYIPVVVAMAASQNVRAAVSGGTVAIVGGVTIVAVSFALVPAISRLALASGEDSQPMTEEVVAGDDEK